MSELNKLRAILAIFVCALAIPAVALIVQALDRLQWEAFHQHQLVAEELARRIDTRLAALIQAEDARAVTEYAYFNVLNPNAASLLQRSPLAQYPPAAAWPGLIGYFQVDPRGLFSAPIVPPQGTALEEAGLSADELAARDSGAAEIQRILAENRLLSSERRSPPAAGALVDGSMRMPAYEEDASSTDGSSTVAAPAPARVPAPAAQAAFDQLNAPLSQQREAANSLGRVQDFKLEKRLAEQTPTVESGAKSTTMNDTQRMRQTRKEQGALPEIGAAIEMRREVHAEHEQKKDSLRIRTFESEVDPLQVSLLNAGQLVVFRNVWRSGERYVQGFLLDRERLFADSIAQPFRDTALSRMSTLLVAHRGDVLGRFDALSARHYRAGDALRGTLLYQTRLSAPFSDFELLFSVDQLPAGPGATVIGWLAAVLALVLGGGSLLMYRLGARQIALARQQQDFVSAVSHELKTPLTSIRMYGEMLREGWAPEEKRQSYYTFIHDESERLSRLINNVLSLARMTRHELQLTPQTVTVGQLADLIRSKAGSIIEQAGRTCSLHFPPEVAAMKVEVDLDAFTQIVLNLVDNALKFSAGAANQDIRFEGRALVRQVEITVRDHGPGIPRDQLAKVFGLFYRVENALTRETVGTGIGLALVSRLAQAMHGTVDVVNREPGAEFRLRLPCSQ